METRKSMLIITLFVLAVVCSSLNRIDCTSTAISSSQPSFVELGYGPGDLTSIQYGIPVFAPGDSLWFHSTSKEAISVQIISANGTTDSTRSILPSAVYDLHSFSSSDAEGNWSLEIGFSNLSTLRLEIPFFNPLARPIGLSLSNYSLGSGNLNLDFAVAPNNAYNLQTCIASSDVNSTLVIPIPARFGSGEVLVLGGTRTAELSIEGSVSSPFTFWYEMAYSYAYHGKLAGEYISRDISVFKSNAVVITDSIPTSVQISNYTSPRPGRYAINAYFENSNGIAVEQTTALLLTSLNWLWTGQCSAVPLDSLSFSTQQSLEGGTPSWPSSVYYMYEMNGVDWYSFSQIPLEMARVDMIGSISGSSLRYLEYVMTPNPNIDQSTLYDNSIFLVGKSFPIVMQVTPIFGASTLPAQNVTISDPFTIKQDVIGVGQINASIANNTAPISSVSVMADNGQGGYVSSKSNAEGIALLTLPAGNYNVTVTSGGQSLTKSVSVPVGQKMPVQFLFSSSKTSSDDLEYVLISLGILGLLGNIVLWFRLRK